MNIASTLRESFSPLKMRNFRIYLGGQAISLVGTWLQMTAQSWVVWELSHSATALGVTMMLSSLPILLLGPWAGVWADRLDRRKLLIAHPNRRHAAGFYPGPADPNRLGAIMARLPVKRPTGHHHGH